MNDERLNRMRSGLQRWLAARWPSRTNLQIGAIQFPNGAGNSAETSFLTVSYSQGDERHSQDLVVRRQLEGFDLFLDSDLNLQYQMMKIVAERSSVPVPPVVGIEFDRSVLGSPFLVMQRVPGRIVPQTPNYNKQGWLADLAPLDRGTIWRNAIQAMASVNRLDWRDGFAFLDRPERGEAGLDQYLNGLEIWYRWAAKGRHIPILEAGMEYLREKRPIDAPVEVLWGDSHAANILFREDLSVAAVIDWEAASIGTAEVDFGYWLFFDELFSTGAGVDRLEGLPGRDEMIACYEKTLGRPARHVHYFEILGAMRFAIVLVRFADRMVALGRISSHSKAGMQNPATQIMSEKLGIAPPGDLTDFISMTMAAGRN
jgi:aminoglycoside phosphotransferase (APT) family kinase protein